MEKKELNCQNTGLVKYEMENDEVTRKVVFPFRTTLWHLRLHTKKKYLVTQWKSGVTAYFAPAYAARLKITRHYQIQASKRWYVKKLRSSNYNFKLVELCKKQLVSFWKRNDWRGNFPCNRYILISHLLKYFRRHSTLSLIKNLLF